MTIFLTILVIIDLYLAFFFETIDKREYVAYFFLIQLVIGIIIGLILNETLMISIFSFPIFIFLICYISEVLEKAMKK